MTPQTSRHRLESLHRRKNRSVLQMIQTLEICSVASKGDAPSPISPCSFILPDGIDDCGTLEESKCCNCNDDDTFTSALCGSTVSTVSTVSTNAPASDADTSISDDELVAERPTISTTISTRRQRRAYDTSSANYSDFCDNDLSRRIEAMVFEIESAYENRRVERSEHIIDQHSHTERMPFDTSELENDASDESPETSFRDAAFGGPGDSSSTERSKPIEETFSTAGANSLCMLRRVFHARGVAMPCLTSSHATARRLSPVLVPSTDGILVL